MKETWEKWLELKELAAISIHFHRFASSLETREQARETYCWEPDLEDFPDRLSLKTYNMWGQPI